MKILLTFLMVVQLSYSYSQVKHSTHFDYNNSENPWIDAFKDRVFFSALKEAYKTDTLIFKLIEKKDALNPYDGLSPDEMKKAESLGEALIKKIPPPAMCENCPAGMNYFMATSLHYYISRELDSIAKKLYKKRIKGNKKVFGVQN